MTSPHMREHLWQPRSMRPGPYGCECNPTYGMSCEWCDGTRDERYVIGDDEDGMPIYRNGRAPR